MGGSSEENEFASDLGNVVAGNNEMVTRKSNSWTPAIHELLNHLESVEFPYSPRVRGFDENGNELLSHIQGVCGKDAWAMVVPESGLQAFARLLRSYHDAVSGFRPSSSGWALVPRMSNEDEIICHGDFGPWNTVWEDGIPVGIIDWDLAAPRLAIFDIAYALEYVAPFRNDDECVRWLAYPEPPDRARRIDIFLDAYGFENDVDIIDAVVTVQEEAIRSVQAFADRGLQPQVEWVANGHLDELAKRVEWTKTNSHLFHRS